MIVTGVTAAALGALLLVVVHQRDQARRQRDAWARLCGQLETERSRANSNALAWMRCAMRDRAVAEELREDLDRVMERWVS